MPCRYRYALLCCDVHARFDVRVLTTQTCLYIVFVLLVLYINNCCRAALFVNVWRPAMFVKVVQKLSPQSVIELGDDPHTWGMNATVNAHHLSRSR